jgi:hypothetical protein
MPESAKQPSEYPWRLVGEAQLFPQHEGLANRDHRDEDHFVADHCLVGASAMSRITPRRVERA